MFLLSSTSAKLAICDLYELSPPPQLISYFITSTILPITSCSQAHSEPVVLRTRHLRIAHPSTRRTVPQHALRSRQMPSKTQDARFSASLLPSRQMRSRTAECAIFLNRLRSTCGAELADTDTQKEYDTNCGVHRLFSAPSQRERRMRDFQPLSYQADRCAAEPRSARFFSIAKLFRPSQSERRMRDVSTTPCRARSAELEDTDTPKESDTSCGACVVSARREPRPAQAIAQPPGAFLLRSALRPLIFAADEKHRRP